MASAKPDLLELYRSGLISALYVMKAYVEGADRAGDRQLEPAAVRGAMIEIADLVDQVVEARSFETLFGLQARISVWQFRKLGRLGVLSQGGDLQHGAPEHLQEELLRIRSQFQRTLDAASGGSEELKETLQSILTRTSTAYALSARAAEAAMR